MALKNQNTILLSGTSDNPDVSCVRSSGQLEIGAVFVLTAALVLIDMVCGTANSCEICTTPGCHAAYEVTTAALFNVQVLNYSC